MKANPDAFKDGLRVSSSYHQESDDIMAELMASSEQNVWGSKIRPCQSQVAGITSGRLILWDSIVAPDSPERGLGKLDLGLTFEALSSLDSPEPRWAGGRR